MADDSTGVYVSDYYKYQGSTKLSESTAEYDQKKTKKKKSFGDSIASGFNAAMNAVNKAKNAVAKAKNTVNSTIASVKSGLDNAKNSLMGKLSEFQSKYNLSNLFEKIGLGADNPLMKLAASFGLSPSILDNWATDLASGVTSFAEDFISEVNPLQMAGIFKAFTEYALYDKVMLNTVVKPLSKIPNLGFIGSGSGQLNYNNELLKCCLYYDLPKTLEYLDDFNDTKYTSRNLMYRRGNFAAKLGSCKVARYVCEQLYGEYKSNTTGTASDNDTKAFAIKQMIVSIFKDTVVYGYSNFGTSEFNKFVNTCPNILKDFSYYGTTDTTFNGKYLISESDMDVLAPIVVCDYDRYVKLSSPSKNFFKDPGLDYNTYLSESDTWSLNKKYINVRNSFIKTLYIKMAMDPDIPTVNRLVHKALHKRLSYNSLTTFQRAKMDALNTTSNTGTGKVIIGAVNAFANGGLTDGLGLNMILWKLQYKKILKTPEELFGYGTSSEKLLTLSQMTKDVGKFNNYDISDTTDDVELTIESYAKDAFNNILPDVYKTINATIDDFIVINSTGLTSSELQTKINKLYSKNSAFVPTDTFRKMKLNLTNNSYTIVNDFLLYSVHKDNYDGLDQTDKDTIILYSLAYYIITNYAYKYSLESMCSMYGENITDVTYQTNDDGELVLDSDGNPIVLSSRTYPKQDEDLKKILQLLADTIKQIVNYYKSIISGKKYTIKFDNMGIGNTVNDINNVSAYTILGKSNEPVLSDINKEYIFIGWTTDVATEDIVDFDNTYITEDVTYYAVWKEADYFVTYAKLSVENNSTLTEDIIATIDNRNGYIIFPIKTCELTDRNRYIISLDISAGATADVNTGYPVILDTGKSGSMIKVTNPYGNYRTYYLQYVEVDDDKKRIAYITNTANLYNFSSSELSFNESDTKRINVSLSKSGYTFKGWYYSSSLNGSKVSEIPITKEGSFIVLYPSITEDVYAISYKDKYGSKFSGKHTESYPIKATFKASTKLDTPTRDDYVFIGYHRNYQCTDDVISVLPKFSITSDITLYAEWLDSNLYQAKYGTYTINGLEFKLTDLIFYTKYILENKTKFVVTSSGLNLFSLNGAKIKKVDIDGTYVLPLGISHIPDINTFFVATRNVKTGKRSVYYSVDNGLNWELLAHVNNVDLQFFVGTGYQTLDNIKFFKKLIYQTFVLEIQNNEVTINGETLYNKNNVSEWEDGASLIGMAITIDKSLYLLFNDLDIIQITDVDISQKENGSIISPNIDDVNDYTITGTSDTSKYEIDTVNMGSAYNNTRYDTSVDDDFDINDTASVMAVLDNNKETRITINTYRNAGRLSYIPDGEGGNTIVYDESKPDMWVWETEKDSPILKLANYDSKGLYIPSILKPIEEVTLERYDGNIKTIPENLKPWSDDLVADKSEVEEINGNIVYKGRDAITPSDDFTKYNDTTGVDYSAMAKESQNNSAEEFKKLYPSEPMTDDTTGKTTYGEITSAFYEYITEGYKQDNNLQEKARLDKEGSSDDE